MKKLNQHILTVTCIALALFLSSGCKTAWKVPLAHRVLLIGIDGIGADSFQITATPYLMQLVREGALSIKARSVMPTVSTPSWGSILTGAGPEQHGMTSNDWRLDNYTIVPT